MRYIFLLLLLLCSNVQAQTPAELRGSVDYFASDELRGRATGSPGIVKAQEYIADELCDVGIKVHYQRVPNLDCNNLIAWVDGTSKEYIIVGAHLDHVGVKQGRVINGADDNASGSAALLGLAKRLADTKPVHTLVFVWFTGEERGLIGSRYYTLNPHYGRLPVFMLNLDMIGHLSDEIPDRKVTQPDKVLAPLFEKYPFAERITFKGRRAASDHLPFVDKNVASIMLHTGLHKHYHRSTDDTDTLDYFGMAEVCDYAHDIILAVAGEVPEYILGEEK